MKSLFALSTLLITAATLLTSTSEAQLAVPNPGQTAVCASLTAIREISDLQLDFVQVSSRQAVSSKQIRAVVGRIGTLTQKAAANEVKQTASFKAIVSITHNEHSRTMDYSIMKAPAQAQLFSSISMHARRVMMENSCYL